MTPPSDDSADKPEGLQAEIRALPGQWVNGVGSITDERDTGQHVILGMLRTKRKYTLWTGHSQLA